MQKGFFVVGTDTGVGKTTIACQLLRNLKSQKYKTLGFKPIATGCRQTEQGLRSQDALMLQKAASQKVPYHLVNPFAFELPIAPHIAAQKLNIELSVKSIMTVYENMILESDSVAADYADYADYLDYADYADYIVVEGVGGFKVPINSKETTIDLAKAFGFPLILVIGLRLGCLNQSLLTLEAIEKANIKLAAWCGTVLEPSMLALEDNIQFLKNTIPAPCLDALNTYSFALA